MHDPTQEQINAVTILQVTLKIFEKKGKSNHETTTQVSRSYYNLRKSTFSSQSLASTPLRCTATKADDCCRRH